jgi:hypothetical protein
MAHVPPAVALLCVRLRNSPGLGGSEIEFLCFPLALLVGCGSFADVDASRDAPWNMHLKNALWAVDPDTGRSHSEALLLLSSGDPGCDEFTTTKVLDDLDKASFLNDASGLLFALEVDAGDGPLDWTGLNMGSFYYLSGSERSLGVIGFNEGVSYIVSYPGGSSWLRVNAYDGDRVEGEFFATYWSGDFKAENCGPWAEYQWDTAYYGESRR